MPAAFQSGFQAGFQGISGGGGPATYSYTGSGGFTLSGSASQVRGAVRSSAGGLTLGGAATILRGIARSASGGLLFAGHASTTFSSAVQQLIVTPVGGLVLAGGALVARGVRKSAVGGIVLSGAASVSSGAAGAFRALILVAGLLRVLPVAQVGTGKKPIVYINYRLRQRQAAEGTPIVLASGRIRLLRAGETLIV